MVAVNFIPQSIQLAQMRRVRLAVWSKVLVVGVAVLGVAAVIDGRMRAQTARLRAQYEYLTGQLANSRVELRSVTKTVAEVELELERARALRTKRAWSAVLALISRRIPEECWLTSIATDPPASPPVSVIASDAATPRRSNASEGSRTTSESGLAAGQGTSPRVLVNAPRRLKLVGHATTPGAPHEFVARLKEAGAFSEVRLQRLASERAAGIDGVYFSFDLRCEW